MRILIIDDEEDIRDVASLILARAGHQVHCAESGIEGAAAARMWKPDVILLDVVMEGLGGPETLELLRHDPDTAAVPVIFLTGVPTAAERARLLSLGVAGLVEKPFRVNELEPEIRALAENAVAPHRLEADGDLLDRHAINALVDLQDEDDPTFFVDLVRSFKADAAHSVARLRTAAGTSDREGIRRIAHAFKSSSGNVGGAALAARLSQLETDASTRDAAALRLDIAHIEKLVEATVAALIEAANRTD